MTGFAYPFNDRLTAKVAYRLLGANALRIAADSGYGSAEMLDWLINGQGGLAQLPLAIKLYSMPELGGCRTVMPAKRWLRGL